MIESSVYGSVPSRKALNATSLPNMAAKLWRLPSSWASEINFHSRNPGGILVTKTGVASSARPDTGALKATAPASTVPAINKKTIRLNAGFIVMLLCNFAYNGTCPQWRESCCIARSAGTPQKAGNASTVGGSSALQPGKSDGSLTNLKPPATEHSTKPTPDRSSVRSWPSTDGLVAWRHRARAKKGRWVSSPCEAYAPRNRSARAYRLKATRCRARFTTLHPGGFMEKMLLKALVVASVLTPAVAFAQTAKPKPTTATY